MKKEILRPGKYLRLGGKCIEITPDDVQTALNSIDQLELKRTLGFTVKMTDQCTLEVDVDVDVAPLDVLKALELKRTVRPENETEMP